LNRLSGVASRRESRLARLDTARVRQWWETSSLLSFGGSRLAGRTLYDGDCAQRQSGCRGGAHGFSILPQRPVFPSRSAVLPKEFEFRRSLHAVEPRAPSGDTCTDPTKVRGGTQPEGDLRRPAIICPPRSCASRLRRRYRESDARGAESAAMPILFHPC
jgi:hypothetical protein